MVMSHVEQANPVLALRVHESAGQVLKYEFDATIRRAAMITLTTPIQVPIELGSAATVGYNKLRIVTITCDPISMTINAQVQMMVSSNSAQPIIYGTLTITATGGTPSCILSVPSMNFYSSVALSGANLTAVQGWITGLQNNIENGLITIAQVAGIQSLGT